MKRLMAWILLWGLAGPALGAGSVETPVSPGLTSPGGGLVLGGPVLPAGFTQVRVLQYALWTVHQSGRRLSVLGDRFPGLSSDRIELAKHATAQLEGALKEVLKRQDSSSFGAEWRAASTAEGLDEVRKAYGIWEAAVAAPEVRSLINSPKAEAAEKRARASVRQLRRLIEREQSGWPNSVPLAPTPPATRLAGTPPVDGRGSKGSGEPLKRPREMEAIFEHLPEGLAEMARGEYARAYNEAYYDGVTGIRSRKYLDDHVGVFAQEEAHQLVGDVDHFKQVNDEMGGHLIGDATLKAVATIWGQELEKAGEAGVRWGGEEFWGRVRGGEDKAVEVAKSINARVRAEVHQQVGLPKPLTISIGIAGPERAPHPGFASTSPRGEDYRTRVEAFHASFKKADDAVFEAKHRGRDRVVINRDTVMQVFRGDPAAPEPSKLPGLGFLAGVLAVILRRKR